MKVINILVMCTGNSFRSHMAEAYLRHFGNDNINVYSAGVNASGKVYPYAIKLMAEDGIDISKQSSDNVSKYFDIEFDYLITVCDHAKESCPIFPKAVKHKIHQSFEDYGPIGDLSDEDYMATLRPIRDGIKKFSENFVKNLIV